MNDGHHTFRNRGGAWVVTQSVLMAAVMVLGVATGSKELELPVVVTGAIIFLTGGYLGIAGVMVLGRNRTPYPKPNPGSELVRRGIYSRVRHPLYSSVMLASIGWALIWQSCSALVVAFALVPFFRAKARLEERWLREKFPDYREYARLVPGFIPRLKPVAKVCL